MAAEDPVTAIANSTKPVIDTGCRLIDSLLGEPARVVGNILADKLYAWQWRNRIKIAARAKELLDRDKISERLLPPGFLLPLLSAAGDIEQDSLQELWARLLASGVAADDCQHPSYTQVLRQLSVMDARVLK